MDKHLNIVAFDNPYPPTYGGVIDVYYKLKALANLGIKIHLHFYAKEKGDSSELEKICEEVVIYNRSIGLFKHLSTSPYIVQSRTAKALKLNLKKNNYPILFEGLHTTKLITEDASICKRSIIRHHNIEHDYYYGLYKSASNILSKYYYWIESIKLASYLKKVSEARCHLTLSNADAKKLAALGFENITTIPPFHSSTINHVDACQQQKKNKPYVLYHGNLRVSENIAAVDYLLEHVFTDSAINYIIAGASNGSILKNKIKDNIIIFENPNQKEITDLIAQAQVITLVTFQSTGIKLKLIDSLYKGQHVIVNEIMMEGFPLPEITSIAKNADEMKNLIRVQLQNEFTLEERQARLQKMNLHFDNNRNAIKIDELIKKISS